MLVSWIGLFDANILGLYCNETCYDDNSNKSVDPCELYVLVEIDNKHMLTFTEYDEYTNDDEANAKRKHRLSPCIAYRYSYQHIYIGLRYSGPV